MKERFYRSIILLSIVFAMAFLPACNSELPEDIALAYQDLPEVIDYNFHIKPILSDRCYKCHGPDDNTREANFRLDRKEALYFKLNSGENYALVKGNLSKSELWKRIISDNPELQMPPPESHLKLSAKEKALIGKWIEQGAEWKPHWAFIPPQKPLIQNIDGQNSNPIDYFIQVKLKEIGLQASPSTDKERLIRRVSMDLTGLPPTIGEIDAFLQDTSPQAYEQLVDRLLSSPTYGERMAMEWMDVARYADSHGLHADGLRNMWPWRDWVIKAFNKNLSYRDFVTWQLAGDLLPNATREQKLATAFHRNHPINSESGIVSEEFRVKYVADRTNTTATAFMGLTMECATCHDHKFDPISQKEYYQMSAFFNNVNELGMIGNDKNFGPLLLLPEPAIEAAIEKLEAQIEGVKQDVELRKDELSTLKSFVHTLANQASPIANPDRFYPLESITKKKGKNGRIQQIIDNNLSISVSGEPELVSGKIGKAIRIDNDYEVIRIKGIGNFNLYEQFSAQAWIKPEEKGSFQTIMGNIGGKNSGWRGWIFYLDSLNRPAVKIVHSHSHNYLHIVAKVPIVTNDWTKVSFTYDGSASAKGLQVYVNGQIQSYHIYRDQLYKSILPVKGRGYTPDPARSITIGRGDNYLFTDTDNAVFIGSIDQIRLFNNALTTLEIAQLYQKDVPSFEAEKQVDPTAFSKHYFQRKDQKLKALQAKMIALRKKKYDLLEPVQEVMVLEEMEQPRATFILDRGQYDMPTEEVFPNTLSALPGFPEGLAKNRLGLAKWLFSDQHPLTARVTVNRYWQLIFGRGIVNTPHDFGSQGALPSHPELLDWLAIYLKESDWDIKGLLKLMVLSDTYRQSSVHTEVQAKKDPDNKYLSRAPSYRLSAEMIRDNALAASGLLQKKIGGPSVKPYQPEGLWKEKNEFSGFLNTYQPDTGDNLYRRSLYTFIRRTSPPPSMLAFDQPSREICTVKRESTNTPLQALILMNDPQLVEASRMLAERMQKEAGENLSTMSQFAFRLLCGRKPNKKEQELMQKQYDLALNKFKAAPESADALLEVGEFPFDTQLDKIQTAALAMVANTILNFDEAYMKR